jgi:Na+/proline symporter
MSFAVIISGLDNGMADFFATGMSDSKFRMVEWSWDYTTAVLWVVIIGGLAQQLVPYSSDQGVVQRYMSVSTRKKAASSIWTNAGLSFFASILFFSVGTALYVFYKNHPRTLDPGYQPDAVFPLFIAQNLPIGVAGIVIAGIFAAAQSTISTSMNSVSTVFTTDFMRRFNLIRSEKGYLNLARLTTVVAGILGRVVAAANGPAHGPF